MIRLTSYLNGSPIYVPADVVIKANYEYEFEMNHALPTSKYKQLAASEEKPQANECWELAANARAKLVRLAGLEEPNHKCDAHVKVLEV